MPTIVDMYKQELMAVIKDKPRLVIILVHHSSIMEQPASTAVATTTTTMPFLMSSLIDKLID